MDSAAPWASYHFPRKETAKTQQQHGRKIFLPAFSLCRHLTPYSSSCFSVLALDLFSDLCLASGPKSFISGAKCTERVIRDQCIEPLYGVVDEADRKDVRPIIPSSGRLLGDLAKHKTLVTVPSWNRPCNLIWGARTNYFDSEYRYCAQSCVIRFVPSDTMVRARLETDPTELVPVSFRNKGF